MQVEDEVLLRLEKGGKGKTIYAVGGDIESSPVNSTDPNTEVDGERSSMKTSIRFCPIRRAQGAWRCWLDRNAIQKVIYGRRTHHRQTTSTAPRQFVSRTRRGSSASKRRGKLLTMPGGSRVRTASARRTARS